MNFDDYNTTVPYVSYSDRITNPEGYAAYTKDCSDKIDKFKKDLFDELGIANNPKREKLYAKAYQMGHAYCYSDIYGYACDLVELIED